MPKCFDDVGERLRELRKEKKVFRNGKIEIGMTQKEVAERIGIHEKSYNAYEAGRRKKSNKEGESTRPDKESVDISNAHLCALADLYGVSVDYILGRTEYRTVNADDIAALTGLSDSAIAALKLCGGGNPMTYHHARDVSRLLMDWQENRANSLLSVLSQFIQCPDGAVARITPGTGSTLAALGAVEMDMNAALLYGVVAAAERYKRLYQEELKAAREAAAAGESIPD